MLLLLLQKKEDTGSPVQGNYTSKEVYTYVSRTAILQYNFNTFPNDETFLSIISYRSFPWRRIKKLFDRSAAIE